MYRGFNVDLSALDKKKFLDDYLKLGEEIHQDNKNVVKEKLDSFEDESGSLIASKIIAEWFPPVDTHVFLSHSHKDEPLVIAFSGFLKEKFDLTSFVDSCIWGYSEDLLRIIDNQYCYQESKKTYSYEKRNRSTSHVYMMLSTALAKMINACESIFFINTPNSISSKDYIKGVNTTDSPWIYSEIAMASIVHRRSPQEHRRQEIIKAVTMESADFNVKYDVDLRNLTSLETQDLINWEKEAKSGRGAKALDVLYGLKGN